MGNRVGLFDVSWSRDRGQVGSASLYWPNIDKPVQNIMDVNDSWSTIHFKEIAVKRITAVSMVAITVLGLIVSIILANYPGV